MRQSQVGNYYIDKLITRAKIAKYPDDLPTGWHAWSLVQYPTETSP